VDRAVPSNRGAGCHGRANTLALGEQAETRHVEHWNEATEAVVEQAEGAGDMFKYAVFFLVLSLIAGALGLTNVSRVAKRISLVLFALLFLVFLALIGFAYLLSEATAAPAPMAASATLRA
jgi:uncharacterized membrane protein YtjA (UPF0391 family)